MKASTDTIFYSIYCQSMVVCLDSELCTKVIFILGSCLPLTAPKNGMIKCKLGDDRFATKEDTCTFTCNDGFKLYGSSARECWIWRGRTYWTGYEAVCKEGNTK